MIEFNIEDIIKAKEFLNYFNSFKLDEIALYEQRENELSRNHIVPSAKVLEEWKFIGLSNVDFVMMEVYKEGL